MNANKICFIMCSNNELYEKECLYYIKRLYIPAGFEIDIKVVKGAASMTAGYNQAMKESDAKYKVYLHQDVLIVNQNFITDILTLFQRDEIGMIGIVGNTEVRESAVMWYGKRVGMLHSNSVYFADSYLFGEVEKAYQPVEAVDGLLMVTQYDIPWREELFRGWDFYDMSQSFEFRRKGYCVVVPKTEKPWCVHDDGILNLSSYYQQREIFLREYIHSSKTSEEKE